MSLAYYARNGASAERMSRRIRKEGITGKGSRIWTEAEDKFLQANYPNFELIREHLSHRTRGAIWARCQSHRLKRAQHPWTAFEPSKL